MKKLLISFITLLLTATAIQAQEVTYDKNGRQDPSTIWVNKVEDGQEWRDENRWHDPFDIYAGPVGGMMASKMTKLDGKYMFAPYFGGILHVYFNNHFGMSFEIGYSHQGVRDAWDNFHRDEDMAIEGKDENGNPKWSQKAAWSKDQTSKSDPFLCT